MARNRLVKSEECERVEPTQQRQCPNCGALGTSAFCPDCGSPLVGPTVDPSGVFDPTTVVDRNPELPTQPIGPLPQRPAGQAWSQAEPELGPPSAMLPGWTGMQSTVVPAGASAARRRRALWAVAGVVLATAVIVLIAVLVAPGRHTAGPDSADRTTSTGPSQRPTTGTAVEVPPTLPTDGTPSVSGSAGPATTGQGPLTVTVTATPTTTATRSTSSAKSTTPTTTKSTTSKPATSKSTPKDPLGVPQREISCGGGYIVQLASEVNAADFTRRVAELRSAGRIPSGAYAADSTKSCKIFSGQVNTLVLYAGPFAGPYDGCAARLAGPADAFIRGQSPDTSHKYVSCLCPAKAASLPRLDKTGQQDVWVGELQRALGNRLNMDIGDVGRSWGTYTADTRKAVERFQSRSGLKDTGQVDAKTWKALQSATC